MSRVFPRHFYRMRRPSLAKLTGDDNSATLGVTAQIIWTSPKKCVSTIYIIHVYAAVFIILSWRMAVQINNGRHRGTREDSLYVSTRFSLSMEMSRLKWDETAKPVWRDQIPRRERGQVNIHFPVQLTTRVWQPHPVDPYSCCMCDHTCTHTYMWM